MPCLKHRDLEKHQGSAYARGYDKKWTKLRNRYWVQHPFCEHCPPEKKMLADEVDHIVPFNGRSDPLRLDWQNLQSLCREHHRKKQAGYRVWS